MEAVVILQLSLGWCSQEQDQWPQFCQDRETGLASKSQKLTVLTAGFDDLTGLFQTERFYESVAGSVCNFCKYS